MKAAEHEKKYRAAVISHVDKLVEKWKPRFGLQDWDIRVAVVRHFDMPADAWATVNFQERKQGVWITLREPRDRDGRLDIEETLVHELVHVVLGPIAGEEVNPATVDALERVVERLTRAFLRVDRRKNDDWNSRVPRIVSGKAYLPASCSAKKAGPGRKSSDHSAGVFSCR